ncbi:hypothetical protein Ga0080574_TMP4975 (plasmid) [Salipiger abyssi]|uniref:Uncharacterized protein n=1 Tax=Salipiger abyssi TaxID=1250539 RepID=A0A1P8V0V3_9RHOB|nr:hypothetical protein Ga0080574_TMP4975 [Salipiger abyssi]
MQDCLLLSCQLRRARLEIRHAGCGSFPARAGLCLAARDLRDGPPPRATQMSYHLGRCACGAVVSSLRRPGVCRGAKWPGAATEETYYPT